MSPHYLKPHVERALEQRQNEYIVNVKIMFSNQLKSGDLSLRTSTISETRTLGQVADDWTVLVRNGAYVCNPTYGVLAHGVRTSTMKMEKFAEIRDNILHDSRPFIPRTKVQYIALEALENNALILTHSQRMGIDDSDIDS
ncbi:hypothetical protein WHR41_09606 [Cladosporium halotolerans]|uniref:Uncharacterized protein n=1 Tax=Cladosporium halotolerans TaxID=1052096 RepID=A0AB34KCS0_9PEZI